MRKMVRISAIAVAASAVFFYLAASYALRHPESLLTQCVLTSFHLGTDNNALYKVGRSVGRTAYRIAQAESADSDMTTEEEEQLLCVPPEPLPVQEAHESSTVSPEQREFIIRTVKDQLSQHPLNDSNANSRDLPMPFFAGPEFCTPAPIDDEDYPKIMPPCTDLDDTPQAMPPAAEMKRANDSLFEFWQGLFESATEEAESMGAALPQSESHYFHDEEPPQCLEDPAYQHQYPGCPFTGKCPGMERSNSPYLVDPVPTVRPKKFKKLSDHEMKSNGQDDPTAQTSDPSKYELPARLRQLLPSDSTEAEEEPSHSEVDTMEFRPTDARPGEFAPKPM